jgi:hypothetical protein
VARLALAALRADACENRTLTLAGPAAYTTREVIDMCERMSDSTAKVTSVPTWLLRATRNVLKRGDWARDAADRLAFAEVLAGNESWSAPMGETYALLGVDPATIAPLDVYLQVCVCGGGAAGWRRRWPGGVSVCACVCVCCVLSAVAAACLPDARSTTHAATAATTKRPHPDACAQEYFTRIMKKLKEVGATADRTNFYV